LDGLRPLEIEHEAALVAVERDEAHALAVADRGRGAAHVALRRFGLDHGRAPFGAQRAGQPAGAGNRQLDEPNSRQRFWHVDFLALGLSGGGPTHFSVVHQTRTRFSYCIFSPALSMMSLYIGTSRAMRARKTSGPSATTGRPAFTNFSRMRRPG